MSAYYNDVASREGGVDRNNTGAPEDLHYEVASREGGVDRNTSHTRNKSR